jgi:hypothetical protein
MPPISKVSAHGAGEEPFFKWIIAFALLQAEPGSALKGLVVPLGPLRSMGANLQDKLT